MENSTIFFETKCEELQKEFQLCSQETLYQKIIEWGRRLPLLQEEQKNPNNLVSGCQSLLYLHTFFDNEKFYFSVASDALISAGLAAIVSYLYSGEKAEVIVKNPPHILEEIGIANALSPSRANGLASLYIKIREDVIKEVMKQALAESSSRLVD